ncbi:hypothetical protein [Streptomyces sp. NPDC001020]
MKRPSTAVVRAAACVTAAGLLTGCGVQQTDVIEAGGPATVNVFPAPGQRLLLFFLSPQGHLTPVVRPVKSEQYAPAGVEPVDRQKVLAMLFAGPQANERAAGLHTELPQLNGAMGIKSTPSNVTVLLPLAVRHFEATAVRQVVCTVAFADGDGSAEVVIVGNDGTLPAAHC